MLNKEIIIDRRKHIEALEKIILIKNDNRSDKFRICYHHCIFRDSESQHCPKSASFFFVWGKGLLFFSRFWLLLGNSLKKLFFFFAKQTTDLLKFLTSHFRRWTMEGSAVKLTIISIVSIFCHCFDHWDGAMHFLIGSKILKNTTSNQAMTTRQWQRNKSHG